MNADRRRSGSPALLVTLLLIGSLALPTAARSQASDITLDTSGSWVFVAFDEPGGLVTVSDPAASSDWDLAFQGTDVMLNGGNAGPGNVSAICLCQNQWATNDDLQRMTPESELADFEAVTGESIPDDADWGLTAFGASAWFKYNLRDEHMVWPNYNVYLVKRGDDIYKLQITGYYDSIGQPRRVSLRYEQITG